MSTESRNRLSHGELDALLRVWHDANAERAAAGRDELLQRLGASREAAAISPSLEGGGQGVGEAHAPQNHRRLFARLADSTRSGSLRSLRAAASFFLLITLIALLIPVTSNRAIAKPDVIMVPDGGRLEAIDDRGNVIGPCALKHTDVVADIAGPFSRVTLTQQYHNPYDRKIEAVYTFPLSHRSAVDRMVMTVKTPGEPDRIVEGEVKERQQARQMYQAARQAGYVASLLEQERPNIFTQSVANIEPGAQVFIKISYVEMLQQHDGEYSFDFPMVVAPRYIPGSPTASLALLPAELKQRRGVILRGPAQLAIGEAGDTSTLGSLQAGKLESLLFAAQAIEYPGAGGGSWWGEGADAKLPAVWYPFEATYCDGSRELGMLFVDGTGQINNRWFYFDPDPRRWQDMGAGYEPDTNQVPDASRITPMPVRPPLRAGHDVSLTVNIDTGDGGPGIIDVQSDLHEIAGWNGGAHQAGDVPRKATIALKNQREIPNRDFVLRWRCESDAIQEAVFTHADPKWIDRVEVPALTDIIEQGAAPGMTALSSGGGFFTIVIAPPARVDDVDVLPRELIFVLDTSGSMSGQPIEKAKDVMSRAIDAMRPGDTFNMITFSGDTRILWNAPRPNTQTNRDEAQRFLASQAGNGGTEMMSAINVALAPTPRHAILGAEPAALTPLQLANLPADGREVVVAVDAKTVEAHDDPEPSIDSTLIPVNERVAIRARWLNQLRPWLIERENARGDVHLRGKWSTINGERVLEVAEIVAAPMQRDPDIEPMRVVMFLTDGQVGNDDAIIAAVREHAKTTRVFSFGIGDSPNRYLLDGIAQAGRGESEYVNLNNNPDESVQRFVKRIASPVLRDIEIVLSEGLQNGDTVPALDAIPDLWDVKPLIIHGRYPIADGAGAKPPSGQAQSGTITIRGKTMRGEYARTIDITLPQRSNRNPMLPALWARGKIDQIIASDINIKRNGGMVANASAETRNAIVALGERYHIASNFTSFVAVEKTRITVGGQSVLVPVPIELPEGMEWEGVFGGEGLRRRDGSRLAQLQQGRAPPLAVSRIGWKAQVAQMLTFEADAGLNEFGLTNRFLMEGAEAGTHGDGFANEWWYLAGDSAGDPSTGLVNVNTAPAAMLNPNLAYRFSTSGNFAHAPGLDLDAALSQGQQNSPPIVEFAWQNSSPRDFATGGDAMFVDGQDEPFVTDTNAGNGGGGGGFGGGGGGGGIFGEAGNDPARLATPEDLRHSLIDVIQETINPDGWSDLGGDLAELTIENGVFNFRTLKDSPSAQQTVERARGFLTMLAAAIPEVAEVAKVDVPPTQPFDPVADMTPLDETDPDGPVAAGDPAPNAHLIIYDVRDVITVIRAVGPAGEAEAVDQLVDLITSVVAPDHWDVNGGDLGHIQSLKGNLIVTIGPEQHQAIAGLLAKIRAAIAARQHVPEHGAASPQDVAGDAAQRATLVYDVHDLVESLQQPATRNDCLQQLVDTIAETVTPDDWDINGGDVASLRVIEDLLIVTHTHDGHVGVGDALQQLRDTGHIQQPLPAERQPADWPGPRPQTQGAVWKDRLHFTRVPIAFRNDSLEQIFAFFEQVTGLDFAVDWEALAAIGVKPENTVTLQMTDTPMTTALERVLESVGEDGQHPVFIGKDATLLITSPDALPKDEQASAAAIEAVAKAEAAMRERLLEALRHEARLRRVIDQRLWTAVVAAKQNEVALSEAERTLTPALSHPPAGERGMPIVILVNAVDDATVDALKSHGLRIDDRNTRMKLVAGAIDAAKLTDLASLECVRRIEPIVIAP